MSSITQADIDKFFWFHSFEFGNGLAARGSKTLDVVRDEAEAFFGNIELKGRSVLDIGAWTGAYSFDAERRGAARVLATDQLVWQEQIFNGYAAFKIAHELLDSAVEDRWIDIPDISPETCGTFNIVLFLGVFYHLLNPAGLMKQVSQCTSDLFIVETHLDALDIARPAMIHYPGTTLNNDSTNQWGPNPHCMYELLKDCGFERIFYRDSPIGGRDNRKSSIFRQRGIFLAFRNDQARERLGHRVGDFMDLSLPAVRTNLFKPL